MGVTKIYKSHDFQLFSLSSIADFAAFIFSLIDHRNAGDQWSNGISFFYVSFH